MGFDLKEAKSCFAFFCWNTPNSRLLNPLYTFYKPLCLKHKKRRKLKNQQISIQLIMIMFWLIMDLLLLKEEKSTQYTILGIIHQLQLRIIAPYTRDKW